MQHFHADAFAALPAAKAKAQALVMFSAAMIEPAADWRGVAFALHSVVTRKRGKVESEFSISGDIAMQDAADAVEFTPWADYQPTGSGKGMLRARVAVTFADGWSRVVGVMANKRKPWAIAKAVRFAILCYREAACRRVFGSVGPMQHGDYMLDNLFAVPEIVSINSADANEGEADLIWSACEANAATRDLRAGRVDLATYERPADAPFNDEPCAVTIARAAMIHERLERNRMISANHQALCRVVSLVDPWDRGRDAGRFRPVEHQLIALMDADPEGFPLSRDTVTLDEAPPAADHETMLAASAIVGTIDFLDPFSFSLSLPFHERFPLVEDALLAWPALEEIADAPAVVEMDASPVEAACAQDPIDADQDDADAPADDVIAAACLSPAALVEAACEAVEMGGCDADTGEAGAVTIDHANEDESPALSSIPDGDAGEAGTMEPVAATPMVDSHDSEEGHSEPLAPIEPEADADAGPTPSIAPDEGPAGAHDADAAPVARLPSVTRDARGLWTTHVLGEGGRWEGSGYKDIGDVWPGCIVVISTSTRKRWIGSGESLARVHDLPRGQSGTVETMETALLFCNAIGMRFAGPRASMKAFRSVVTHRETCARIAEDTVRVRPDALPDAMTRAIMCWRSSYERRDAMASALSAFLSHDESKAWAVAGRAAWDARREGDGAGEPAEPDAPVSAPDAAAEPAAPATKPRYRFCNASGAWEIVPPVAVEIEGAAV